MSPHLFEKRLPPACTQADNLPSLPAVALDVLRLSRDEEASLDDLARCLSRDPALAAKLLKLANSPLFGGAKEITTLQRATMMLGMKTVKMMALSFSLAGTLPRSGRQGSFDFTVYWHRSLVCATAARSITRLLKNPLGDEAFLCGLFAHFGKLVLTRCLPDEYEAVLVEAGGWPSSELEERRLGFNNADVCAALLRSWELPPLIWVAVGSASYPREIESLTDARQRELTELLHLAQIAESVLCDQDKGERLSELHAEMERLYRVPENEVNALLVGLEAGINEAAELLSIELPPGTSHQEILEQARASMMRVSLGAAVDLAAAERRNRELEAEREALVSRATTDRLTGLPNRESFDSFLEREVRARLRGDVPRALGLLLVDIDHFKQVNDTYGHAAGDEVLRMVGALMDRMTRGGDLSARYGGEEFALVVPRTNPFGLRTLGQRLREAIEAESLEFEGHRLAVTVSLGGACIAGFESPAEGLALIKLADHHLYKAKRGGRNRVEVYSRVEFPRKT